MNWRLIGTLAAKDVSLYFRNKLFTMLTILGLVMFIVIYFVMPKTVDATYQIGVYAPELPPVFGAVSLEEGIEIETVASEEVLKEAFSILDKNVKNKVIHKNNAANKKAKLQRKISALAS